MDFRDVFDITLPIIQAPMAGVQGSALAAAVSSAGGLGSLPCAMLSAQALEAELASLVALTSAPFNLNFFCHTPPKENAAVEKAWRNLLAPYFEELGLDPNRIADGPQRKPFDHATADIIERYKPAVVSFHFGLPDRALLARVKSWGSVVLSSATTVAEARWLQAEGADAVIAQGLEAGGHRGHFLQETLAGQLPLRDLLAAVVPLVDVPVIAAGGIASAADVRECLALGAIAAQVGTAYLLSPQANTSALHRAAIRLFQPDTTALTNLYSGRPARGIYTRLMKELGPMNAAVPDFPLASTAVTALRTAAEAQGDGSFSPLWCGERAGACREVDAGELTRQLASGLQG